ncbi:MAG: hypothetical protein LBS80_06245 [Tannerella sp.]|nr:hypothetical protein [Tannerella sp.]
MTRGSLKGYIFITAGQRPAEKPNNNSCLKGRTPSQVLPFRQLFCGCPAAGCAIAYLRL